ncbi:MAG: CPBP family intramembrane metalloprotease [Verrucomicrobia bacterium]|nr:CPBP family intramembrane metalloprotease [Verrucomicrobiota bacterium]
MDSPLLQIGLLLLIGYIFYLWLSDLKAFRGGIPNSGALPGALPCGKSIVIWGTMGAIILVIVETAGESLLGVSSEQTSMTVLFALVAIASGFGEELIFRGYLVVQHRGRGILWLSIFGFSLLFALVHPYLWEWEDGTLVMKFSAKAWFSTGIVFVNSLWFYVLRFSKSNPGRSLWPCILAHATSNAAVFLTKFVQGHVSAWY